MRFKIMTWADAKTQLTLQHGPKHRLKLWYLSTCHPDAKSRKPEMNQDHFGPKTMTGRMCVPFPLQNIARGTTDPWY